MPQQNKTYTKEELDYIHNNGRITQEEADIFLEKVEQLILAMRKVQDNNLTIVFQSREPESIIQRVRKGIESFYDFVSKNFLNYLLVVTMLTIIVYILVRP